MTGTLPQAAPFGPDSAGYGEPSPFARPDGSSTAGWPGLPTPTSAQGEVPSLPPRPAYAAPPVPPAVPTPAYAPAPAYAPTHQTGATAASLPAEKVLPGLALAAAAVPVGALLTVAVWKVGLVTSITSLVMALAAVRLYVRGAGAEPKRGLWPLVGVVALGVVTSFFAVVAYDLSDYWARHQDDVGDMLRGEFVSLNLFNPRLLGYYVKDGLMMLVFAVLGSFGTIRRAARSTTGGR